MQKIYFLIYNDVEILDFSGPFDVFSMANVASKSMTGQELFELFTVSPDGKTVTAMHGLSVNPDYSIENCPIGPDDVLIVPGGTGKAVNKFFDIYPTALPWMIKQKNQVKVFASICIGAIIAAKADAFVGKKTTTHHRFLGQLEALVEGQDAVVIPGVRYVDNDGSPNIMSSAGVSAGLDLSFYLLGKLSNQQIVSGTMNIMEYNGTTNWAMT